MKMRGLLGVGLFLLMVSCGKEEPTPPAPAPTPDPDVIAFVDGTSCSVEASQDELRVGLTCKGEWTMGETPAWCEPASKQGSGDAVLIFSLDENLFSSSRGADISLSSGGSTATLHVSQAKASKPLLYQLPVVFHIFYDDPASQLQNLSYQAIVQLLEQTNSLLRPAASSASVDMGVELTLATHDEQGYELPEPGVDRIRVGDATMDAIEFLETESNVRYLWDVNSYVNVMLFPFPEEYEYGVSYLAFNTGAGGLEGLSDGSYYLSEELDFPYCITINTTCVEAENPNSLLMFPTGSHTLAHELGHFLGLFHVFLEDGHYDYCDDTYDYDHFGVYVPYVHSIVPAPITALLKRTLKDGSIYPIADNVMDYQYCMLNRFTQDQADRVRYILENGVLLPGPKQDRSQLSKTTPERPTPRWLR